MKHKISSLKVIHCRVHGQIVFHPAVMEVIDTPEFQRLRQLRQLGNCSWVFPGATHSRFEHSLGVSHLAMKMLRQLYENHRYSDTISQQLGYEFPDHDDGTVTPMLSQQCVGYDEEAVQTSELFENLEKDELCLGIAGAVHDLGHGPLSHLFEQYVNEKRRELNKPDWHHESMSIQIFNHIIQRKMSSLAKFGLKEQDFNFIRLLITGIKDDVKWSDRDGEDTCLMINGTSVDIGRRRYKRFLFDIVSNKRNQIDVDRLDYFLRDSSCAFGTSFPVDINRIFQSARVIEVDDEYQICYNEKITLSLEQLFLFRYMLHRSLYRHPVVVTVDDLTCRALRAADAHFVITCSGKNYKLYECVEHVEAYLKLDDSLLQHLLNTNDANLAPCHELLDQIRTRQYYDKCGSFVFRDDLDSQKILSAIMQNLDPKIAPTIKEDDILVVPVHIDFGGKCEPLESVRFFYPKFGINAGYRLKTASQSILRPNYDMYEERKAYVFSRCNDKTIHVINALTAYSKSQKDQESIRGVRRTPDKRPRDDEPFCFSQGT